MRHVALPRVTAILTALLVVPGTSTVASAQESSAARGLEALRSGSYDEAIALLDDAVGENPGEPQRRIDLIEALLAVGRYEDAISTAESAPESASVANARGLAYLSVGQLDQASQAFREGVAHGGPYALTAEVNLAELYFERGEVDEAMQRFDRFIDVYNEADGQLSATDLVAVGRALRYLGRTESVLFQDALRAFTEAQSKAPQWATPGIHIGNLFLEKYDSPTAKTHFEAVLERNPNHPEALLGLARTLIFDGDRASSDALGRVLDVNGQHVGARSAIAMRILTSESVAEARAQAEEALETNPNSFDALAALGGSYLLADDTPGFDRVRDRVLALNPVHARFDVSLAELSVQTRRYRQAVERAAAAVALDPHAWTGWGLLGMNQMRIGLIDEGRENLERAFDGDPYNPWFKNNLDLLDTFDRYESHTTDRFELFLQSDEAPLLANYLGPIAEEAYDRLSTRYGIAPETPIRVELFPRHADFSVRTLGEAGLGALGVSFGPVIVMDSPSARELGDYNWASVFWHELAHTFHLALSNNRVPRWFSEGLAVHDQRDAREGWGHQPEASFLIALRDGRLEPFSTLNDGFMRPDYPQQVVHSYLQASLVFQLIEDQHGFEVIPAMLRGYRDGASTADLVEQHLGTTVEAFDETFDDYLRERFRDPLAGLVELERPPAPNAPPSEWVTYARAHPGSFLARLRAGIFLYEEGTVDAAEEHLRAALRIFPEYGGPDSPYWYLALIHEGRGEIDLAIAALRRLNALSESNYDALVKEARLLSDQGLAEETATTLDRAVLIWPYQFDIHEELAELHGRLGNHEQAVVERGAVVALAPADMATAYYELARAQSDAGAAAGARRSVMRALEIAPNYEDALELLLELRGGTE